MFKASFDGSDVRVVASLRAKGSRIISRLVEELNRQVIGLQTYIVTSKLSGQVLHHRSGKLIASVRAILARFVGTTIDASVEAGGGVAFYGRVHEYGGKGFYEIVPTSKKCLYWESGGVSFYSKRVNHPPAPERSFMRSSLAERRSGIVTALRAAIKSALQE